MRHLPDFQLLEPLNGHVSRTSIQYRKVRFPDLPNLPHTPPTCDLPHTTFPPTTCDLPPTVSQNGHSPRTFARAM